MRTQVRLGLHSLFISGFSALPASVLDEEEDEDDGVAGDERDDERSGTRYNVSIRLSISIHDSWFESLLQHAYFDALVFLVPRNLRNRRDVCCDAPHRLVSTLY